MSEKPLISLIYAQSLNGFIGVEGKLPWHSPKDLAHFQKMTYGSVVLMGRKTWESLPETFRPLAGRVNLVLTRDTSFSAPGAQVVNSIEQALLVADSLAQSLWVIGGGQVYEQLLPYADQAIVSVMAVSVDGDVRAPVLDPSEWELYDSREVEVTKGPAFTILRYTRV